MDEGLFIIFKLLAKLRSGVFAGRLVQLGGTWVQHEILAIEVQVFDQLFQLRSRHLRQVSVAYIIVATDLV